jgi:hypothetical protein
LLFLLLSYFYCNRVYVVRRNLAIFSDFRFGNLAHSALLLEINGQNSLVEYMDTDGGSVSNFLLGNYEDLKNSLNTPTDCSNLSAEDCQLRNSLRETCKKDENCFEFQNYLWQK